jgi:glycosyltransferase involved in cell wall biosynthesis
MKRLFFLTTSDLRINPFPELALPALADDGWDVTLVGPSANESVLNRCLPYRCRRHELLGDSARLGSELEIQCWLQRARFGKYDLVYLQGQPMAPRAALGLAGPLFGKRLIYQTYDFYDPITYPAHSFLEGCIARRASCHLNGEYHRAYFVRTLYRLNCPVLVIPPNLPAAWPIPAQSQDRRRALGAHDAEDVVLMLHGGRSPLRATDQLFAALGKLPRRFRLAMTCPPDPDLALLADSLGITDRVTYLGRLDYADMFSYTVNADIGIMLHSNNDLGNFFQGPGRLTEYMACGLPILASHFTGLQVLLSTNGIGVCADPESPEDIASRLIDIEAGLRTGTFDRHILRQRFLHTFAFDHWRQAVVSAFANVLSGNSISAGGPPQFSTQGAPCYTQ